mgnify:CR=1 FL=1
MQKMPETLDVVDLLPNKFEPKRKNRWVFAIEGIDALIINAGAFTHTSIAIHDTLKILKIPKIEIHISNIYSREEFRKKSFISPVVNGIIAGFGTSVYQLAINSITHLEQDE